MFGLLAMVLAWCYSLWHSYGMAIVLLTLAIMIVLTPLTLKGTRSMMVMQALQPEMKKIQTRYKDDRQKLNEELLQFYKDNKINPLSGCLPLLIQMPVFLVLYRVLRGLTNPKKFGVVLDQLTNHRVKPGFNPSYISHDSKLFQALSAHGTMTSWGMDLSRSAVQVVRGSFSSALPYLVLIAGVVATSYYQQKQVQGRSPAAVAANPQQQMLLKIMPIFFAFISLNLPAALVVYFFVSNLYRVGQQAFISHRIYKPAQAAGLFDAKSKEATPDERPKKGSASSSSAAAGTATAVADGAPKPGGFFGRLLGESAPQVGPKAAAARAAGRNGGAGTTNTKSTQPVKGNGRAPAAKQPTPGRTTPAGAGPQPRARKKKKRK